MNWNIRDRATESDTWLAKQFDSWFNEGPSAHPIIAEALRMNTSFMYRDVYLKKLSDATAGGGEQ